MEIDSKLVERATKNILRKMRSRSPSIWNWNDEIGNEEWEGKVSMIPGPRAVILPEDLAKDKQRKQVIEQLLPHLPREYRYQVLTASGLRRVRQELDVAMPETWSEDKVRQYWDALPRGALPMIASMAQALDDADSGTRVGPIPSGLLEDPEVAMVALPGIGGARVIRCELTDEETGQKASGFLFAHMGLEDLLNSLKKRYYREILHLKEWRLGQIKRKYVPYVRCYGLLRCLGLSEASLKKIRRELWLDYWDEYQERYHPYSGEKRDKERRAFNREVERKSEHIVKHWRRWSDEGRRQFVESWAGEDGERPLTYWA